MRTMGIPRRVGASLLLLASLVACQNNVQTSGSFTEESSWESCICDNGPCSCVVYYLCNPDGVIISTGDTLLDPRFGDIPPVISCPGVQVCCRNPDNATVVPMTPPVVRLPPVTTESTRPSITSEKSGCGLRGTAFDLDMAWSRINIDEGTTAFAEFPWMLALLRKESSGITPFLCGASLINLQVAMTAAHCVNTLKAGDLVVRAGEWNTTSTDEPVAHQDRFVRRIILHPNFTKGSLFNDMALLLLDSPFEDSINVGVVCLPKKDVDVYKTRCIATGWGRDMFGIKGKMQTTLRKVDLPLIDSKTCQQRLCRTRLGIFFRLHESFICAGGEPEKDTCKGDGGGPLMCQSVKDPARYLQVGIVSWGIGCKDSDIPAVYTNVELLSNWVENEIKTLGLEYTAHHP